MEKFESLDQERQQLILSTQVLHALISKWMFLSTWFDHYRQQSTKRHYVENNQKDGSNFKVWVITNFFERNFIFIKVSQNQNQDLEHLQYTKEYLPD